MRFLSFLLLIIIGTGGVYYYNHFYNVSTPDIKKDPTISVNSIAQRVQRADNHVKDPKGWANDIVSALKSHSLVINRENACAVIAVISQESGFVANPAVKNLGKISEKAVKDKMSKYPIVGDQVVGWLKSHPNPKNSFMYQIQHAKTEKDLDLVNRNIIDGMTKQFKLNWLLGINMFSSLIEGENEITTIGSMQASVDLATAIYKQHNKGSVSLDTIYSIRDDMYTRKGGVYYGTAILLSHKTGYTQKIHRFADYNAGPFASRNAGFQLMLNKLLKTDLSLDGDLLLYNSSGSTKFARSNTEKVVIEIYRIAQIEKSPVTIRFELGKEKEYGFYDTDVYRTISRLYSAQFKKDPIRAIVPQIKLDSVKIHNGFTTEKFANMVNKRYQACMK